MRLPPWAIEAIRNGVADVARKASDAETITKVRAQAAELLRDLPENASRSIDAIVKTATETARGALDQGRDSILRWSERQTELTVCCFNASGELLSPYGSGSPLSDAVLQIGCEVLRGDCVDIGLRELLDQSLSKLLSVEGHCVAVAHNFDAAIAAIGALAPASSTRVIAMHRSQAIRLPSGTPLPDAFPGISLTECGGVQAIEPADFDGIDSACLILADDGTHPIAAIDFGSRDVITIAIVPVATANQTFDEIPSAESLLQTGIDLVVFPGGPINGCAESGIIAGKTELIQTIQRDPRWKTYSASDSVAAMARAAMASTDENSVTVLINTGEENLRSRAERMATLLTADASIETCQISDDPAHLVRGSRWSFPSRQLRIRHTSRSSSDWAAELRNRNPAILAGVDGNDLVIDLRWIPASNDATLADSLGSTDPETEENEPATNQDSGSDDTAPTSD